MQPSELVTTQSERICAGILETVGSFLAGGKTAATVSGGAAIFKEVAPEGMQKAAEIGAFAFLANKVGLNAIASLGIGTGMMLSLRNLTLLSNIRKDMKHAWSVCKASPLKIVPKFFIFVSDNVQLNLKGIVKTIKTSNKQEAISRIALFAFTGLGIAFSFGTLPVSIGLFYLVNKVYDLKYEGPSNLNNPQFRAYIVEKYNSDRLWHAEETNLELLKNILKEENPDFQRFCTALDACISTMPEATDEQALLSELPSAI